MKLKALSLWTTLVALTVVAAACTQSSPSRPSDTGIASGSAASVTDARTGVTIVAPSPASPADATEFKYTAQPITVTAKNGITTGSSALIYLFEVASDAAFATKVFTKDNVAQGSGQTSVTVDKLPGGTTGKTYYWRVRGTSGATVGPYSVVWSFKVGPEIILQNPVLASPQQGAAITGTLTLTTANIQRTGPAGPITYRFDLSDSSAFSRILYTTVVAEQGGSQTSTIVPTNGLASGATFFWRVQAFDQTNSLTTGYAGPASFTYTAFDLRNAGMLSSPSDLGYWPETAAITYIDTSGDIIVDFDKRTQDVGKGYPGRWPDEAFGSGSIEYTLGMCVKPGAAWYCSTVVQFWYGRDLAAGGPWDYIGRNWFYDPARWGPIAGYQPNRGETIGLFVASGNLRGRTDASTVSCPTVCERSNVVLLPLGGGYQK